MANRDILNWISIFSMKDTYKKLVSVRWMIYVSRVIQQNDVKCLLDTAQDAIRFTGCGVVDIAYKKQTKNVCSQ